MESRFGVTIFVRPDNQIIAGTNLGVIGELPLPRLVLVIAEIHP